MKKQFFVACALSVFTLPVLADSFYISGDVGQAKWSFDSGSDTDTGFGFAGGYKFNDTFAVELGYRDLGGFEASSSFGAYSVDLSATQLSILASHSLNDTLSVYGRLGFASLKVEASYNDDTGDESRSRSKTKAVYGIGGRYSATEKLGIHLEYNRYAEYNGLTASALLAGLDYQF